MQTSRFALLHGDRMLRRPPKNVDFGDADDGLGAKNGSPISTPAARPRLFRGAIKKPEQNFYSFRQKGPTVAHYGFRAAE
jgi:hypothetical protein